IRLCRISSPGSLQARKRIVDDVQRILTSGIIAGDDDVVATFPSGFSHQGTLRAVAISAATKDGDDLAFGPVATREVASKPCEILKSIVGVRVVDDHCERLPFIDLLKSSGNATHLGDPFCN